MAVKVATRKCGVALEIKKRCNKLCHSSPVKLPFVEISASWFLFSTYLIWTFESKLILSNDQSRATRWLQDTCIIVGLLPFDYHLYHNFIVFESVQLSKNMTHVRWIHILIQHLCNLRYALGLNTSFPCACLGWFWYSWSFPAPQ